uniref:Uncharacterized protein n=1 Tax=Trypanosoma rangeli TaxID=5698 RepID=R9TNI8_TRYRA|nr:hypothetical protein [Trypanosoma rangeli]
MPLKSPRGEPCKASTTLTASSDPSRKSSSCFPRRSIAALRRRSSAAATKQSIPAGRYSSTSRMTLSSSSKVPPALTNTFVTMVGAERASLTCASKTDSTPVPYASLPNTTAAEYHASSEDTVSNTARTFTESRGTKQTVLKLTSTSHNAGFDVCAERIVREWALPLRFKASRTPTETSAVSARNNTSTTDCSSEKSFSTCVRADNKLPFESRITGLWENSSATAPPELVMYLPIAVPSDSSVTLRALKVQKNGGAK